ncbi:hypothetical protein KUL152_24120 [Tenacibaculum sp. KUL152]|nr:hypothetical protein KUL152_24120 [Tenacibaculum sp. KUL152]
MWLSHIVLNTSEWPNKATVESCPHVLPKALIIEGFFIAMRPELSNTEHKNRQKVVWHDR